MKIVPFDLTPMHDRESLRYLKTVMHDELERLNREAEREMGVNHVFELDTSEQSTSLSISCNQTYLAHYLDLINQAMHAKIIDWHDVLGDKSLTVICDLFNQSAIQDELKTIERVG